MNGREAQKRTAAEHAVQFVKSGMRLGLGTGSTARHVLEVLAERLRARELGDIVGVATSRATVAHARQLGIPLCELDEVPRLDLAIDGADEVDPQIDLIKGLGGALLWEKIVESQAAEFVVVVDDSKLVPRLGVRAPVPVEVVSFGWRTLLPQFEAAGAVPVLRTGTDGQPFVTDCGNYIVDCRFPDGMADAAAIAARLKALPGVVETGLFIGMATSVVVAGETVEVRRRQDAVAP